MTLDLKIKEVNVSVYYYVIILCHSLSGSMPLICKVYDHKGLRELKLNCKGFVGLRRWPPLDEMNEHKRICAHGALQRDRKVPIKIETGLLSGQTLTMWTTDCDPPPSP